MSSASLNLGGSRSQVTRHVFLLCALCSLLPTLVIGALVYTRVTAQADAALRGRLHDTAKSYGMLLQERLDLAADELIGIGRRGLARQPAQPDAGAGAARRVQGLVLQPLRAMPALSSRSRVRQQDGMSLRDESLRVTRGADRKVQVRLSLIVGDSSGRAVTVSAEVRPEYLWNTDVVGQAGMRLCVQSDDDALGACPGEGSGKNRLMRESWGLFLLPRFAAPGWTVSAAQPVQQTWSRLTSALDGMPLIALAALLVALLIGSFEARRAHRPLSELLRAFRAMARGQFVQVGLPTRRNEYSALGQAFNQLSRTLRRQFRLLATLERMDQAILQRPAIEELVESMLPRLPGILDCECVGIAVSGGTGRPIFCWVERSGRLERPPLGMPASALEQLRNQRPDLQWEQMPLRVSSVTRGWLICGRDGAMPRAIRRQAKGVARRFAVALRNEERERMLLRQALTDELTQLPNRRQLQEHVQQVLGEAATAGESFAFVYLDLDRFKTLNDSLGHRCGDELLFQLAGTLTHALQPTDMVARIGGDEFALLLRDVTAAQARARLEEMQARMREPIHVGGISIQPQASIGIAMYPADGRDFDVLLRNADVAMYRGKVGGGGRIVFFEERMNEQAVRRLQIESCLRQALGTDRLQLHFQPKVSLTDGSLHGVEALMRWEDPGLGTVSPAEFIPVAEESELIQELGRFALERALEFCRQCMDSDTPVGHVAVNVSMLQLCDAGLVEFLQRQLSARRVPAAMLQIEITESSIMRDPAMVRDVLARIRELGIRIAIDDFGTGYSSLAVLRHLPVNMLKIDRSFISPIGQSAETLELVRAMLAVCRALGLESVAEGVETTEQHEMLASNGCDYAQGYLYSRAVCGPAALELIRGWHLHQEPTPWIMRA